MSSRARATGVATALALGFAAPAQADDSATAPVVAPSAPVVTAPAPPTTPAAPTAPAVVDADAVSAQVGASNLDVSVRIDSPGDDGAVTQTISADASSGGGGGTAGASALPASTAVSDDQAAPPASSQGVAEQIAPQNVNVSVRIGSSGDNGPVSQTITASAPTTATLAAPSTATASPIQPQYQAPSTQYQATSQPSAPSTTPSPTTSPTASPSAATASPSAAAPTVPASTASLALPTTWIWNWSWACGDIAGGGITQAVDTAIETWNWTWNLGGVCSSSPLSPSDIHPVINAVTIPTDFSTDFIPAHVEPPTPPAQPAVLQAPTGGQMQTATQAATPAPEAAEEPPTTARLAPAATEPSRVVPGVNQTAHPPPAKSVAGRGAVALIRPWVFPRELRLSPTVIQPRLSQPRTLGDPRPAPATTWTGFEPTSATHASAHATLARAQKRKPALRPVRDPPAALGAVGVAVAGSSGGSGGGSPPLSAALGLWLLCQLPALVALRVPLRQRFPRSRPGDAPDRPG